MVHGLGRRARGTPTSARQHLFRRLDTQWFQFTRRVGDMYTHIRSRAGGTSA